MRLPLGKTLVTLAAAAGLAAACSTPPDSPDFPVPRYTQAPPIKLDVAEIRVEQSYEPPLEKPNVEHIVPLRPADAARQWVKDRLQGVGRRGTATVDIVTASVTEESLETEGGVGGFLTTEPETRYTAKMELAVDVERPADSGSARVRGARGTGVLEGSSINAREMVVYDLVKNLMTDIDGQMADTLNGALGRFVAE